MKLFWTCQTFLTKGLSACWTHTARQVDWSNHLRASRFKTGIQNGRASGGRCCVRAGVGGFWILYSNFPYLYSCDPQSRFPKNNSTASTSIFHKCLLLTSRSIWISFTYKKFFRMDAGGWWIFRVGGVIKLFGRAGTGGWVWNLSGGCGRVMKNFLRAGAGRVTRSAALLVTFFCDIKCFAFFQIEGWWDPTSKEGFGLEYLYQPKKARFSSNSIFKLRSSTFYLQTALFTFYLQTAFFKFYLQASISVLLSPKCSIASH